MAGVLLGPRALMDIAMPTGTDASEILRFQLRDGMTAQEAIGTAVATIGTVNEKLNAKYGGLFYMTSNFWTRMRQGEGTRTMTPVDVEFANPDGVRTNKVGSMLPIRDYTDAVQWSRRYLERSNRDDVRDDLALIAERWESRIDYDILTRLFSISETVIGSTGYDVPFAIGTGTNVNFIPPTWGGYQFDTTHTHYKYANSSVDATSLAAMLNTLSNEVRHHGHTGRLVAFVSDADITYFTTAMTGFVPLIPFSTVGTGTTGIPQYTPGEVTGTPGELAGYFNSVRGVIEIRFHPRIPTGYMAVFKTYGLNSPKNPLAVRYEEGRGFGMTVEPQLDRSINPKMDTMLFSATHGVGVNDRTAAALGYIASGASAYVSPTIS